MDLFSFILGEGNSSIIMPSLAPVEHGFIDIYRRESLHRPTACAKHGASHHQVAAGNGRIYACPCGEARIYASAENSTHGCGLTWEIPDLTSPRPLLNPLIPAVRLS